MRKQSPNESLGDCCVSGRDELHREFYLNELSFMMICKLALFCNRVWLNVITRGAKREEYFNI